MHGARIPDPTMWQSMVFGLPAVGYFVCFDISTNFGEVYIYPIGSMYDIYIYTY